MAYSGPSRPICIRVKLLGKQSGYQRHLPVTHPPSSFRGFHSTFPLPRLFTVPPMQRFGYICGDASSSTARLACRPARLRHHECGTNGPSRFIATKNCSVRRPFTTQSDGPATLPCNSQVIKLELYTRTRDTIFCNIIAFLVYIRHTIYNQGRQTTRKTQPAVVEAPHE